MRSFLLAIVLALPVAAFAEDGGPGTHFILNWDLDGDGPETVGADEQEGFYIEPSYRITPKWGVFARYNQWDNQAGDGNSDSEKKQVNTGVNSIINKSV